MDEWKTRALAAEMRVSTLDGTVCSAGREEGRGGCGLCPRCCHEAREAAVSWAAKCGALNTRMTKMRSALDEASAVLTHLRSTAEMSHEAWTDLAGTIAVVDEARMLMR